MKKKERVFFLSMLVITITSVFGCIYALTYQTKQKAEEASKEIKNYIQELESKQQIFISTLEEIQRKYQDKFGVKDKDLEEAIQKLKTK